HTRSKRDWSSDVCSSDLIHHAHGRQRYLLSISRQVYHQHSRPVHRKSLHREYEWHRSSLYQEISHVKKDAIYPRPFYFHHRRTLSRHKWICILSHGYHYQPQLVNQPVSSPSYSWQPQDLVAGGLLQASSS